MASIRKRPSAKRESARAAVSGLGTGVTAYVPARVSVTVEQYAGVDASRAIEALAVIGLGKPHELAAHFGPKFQATLRERLAALSALLDIGFGEPERAIEVRVKEGHNDAR
jgi:hypothetical protein